MPRYNQYNRNRMSLNTVDFQPTVFTPIEFRPVEQDYSILERAMAKQEERKQQALSQQTNIKAAISQVELDESEDEWKQNYINNINKQINDAAAVGDYAGALETATMIAGDVANDPALRGRERYNKERQEFIKSIEAKRNADLISETSYRRALAQNTYNYEDIKDDNGRIVAGSKWTPAFDPAKDFKPKELLDDLKKYIGVSKTTTGGGGGTTQQYYDKNGNPTTKASEAVSIASTTKGGSRTESLEEVTEQQWRDAYDAWMQAHDLTDREILYQVWDNYQWDFAQESLQVEGLKTKLDDSGLSEEERLEYQKQYDKHKEKADRLWSNMTDGQGGLLTRDEFLLSHMSPYFKVMAYRNHTLVTEAGSTLIDETTLRNKTIAKAVGLTMTDVELMGSSAPVETYYEFLSDNAKQRVKLNNEGDDFITEVEKTNKKR